jgi:hypothetical protein
MDAKKFARVIYWRARPGQFDAYSEYVENHVEPIDQEALRRGSLLSFTTLVDASPGAAWTHMRIFVFANEQQRARMVEALGLANAALHPDPAERAARVARAATLRDKVGESDLDVLG